MNPARILIIEDDATLLRGLRDNFAFTGYQVDTASDGHEGLAKAIANAPDVVLLDIMLPGQNGFEVCRELRSRRSQATIIMLTAKAQEADIVRGLELGADDYVTKPFSIRELLARVRAFLRRKVAPQTETICFGPFELNRASRQLRKGASVVPLTSKEYGLLEFLASRPGRVFTRSDVLDAVWGRSAIVSQRSVDRCVTTLRGKIESDPRNPRWIQTIRDVGYRFEPDAETECEAPT